MRSKLFVPGSRPELFAKALAGPADALSFDLEDSVPEARKDEARAAVAAFVAGEAMRGAAKVAIVRVNAPGTPHFAQDAAAFGRGFAGLVNLPKIEDADGLRRALEPFDAATRVLVNIETPRALRNAAAIAQADRRVAGLQLGLADLFEPLGIARRDPANVHAAMFALRMAAAEAGVFALDAAWGAIDDAEGFAAEAAMARRLGFLGKSCIHPRQVPLANAAFAPSDAELERARRIVAAAREAREGAFVLDGQMIDLPFVKRAQALLAGQA